MFGSSVLEVAVGLSATYWVFGSMSSGIREVVATTAGHREELLARGVYRLLGQEPPAVRAREAFGDASTAPKDPVPKGGDAHAEAMTADDLDLARLVLGHPLIGALGKSRGSAPSYIPARTFALALLDVLSPERLGADVGKIQSVVARIADPGIRNTLMPIVNGAGGDLQKLRGGIERHFDDAMDRVSGWYKRRSQLWLFGIGLAVAIAFNVDTVHIAKELWASPQNGAPNPLELPLGWRGMPTPGSLAGGLLGYVLTATALTLGTPFWFEVLTRFVNLRASGPPPAKSVGP